MIGAMLHAMGLLRYAILYGQLLLALAFNPDARAVNWVDASAQVVSMERRTDQNDRQLARVVLRYADASGQEQAGSFEVFSPLRGLGHIKQGDRLTIKVCRHDPTIIKAGQFLLSEQRRCAPVGIGKSPEEPRNDVPPGLLAIPLVIEEDVLSGLCTDLRPVFALEGKSAVRSEGGAHQRYRSVP